MAGLRLGPLLRYVDEDTATVWIETDGAGEAEVRCTEGTAGGTSRTWQVFGHHYALITVVGLEPGAETPYEVLLDGARVWPLPGSPFPVSTICTPAPDTTDVKVTFGSCRWASRPAHSSHDPVGPDALDALAQQALSGGPRPDVLVLLGDQVYADETSERVRSRLARNRDLTEPPWDQVADFEEYTELYDESWLDPEVRWLLSTVPSCMIFDDHDVIDDWNTSESWRDEMRATGWWRDRILGGLSSYWVYQHLGNMTPGELSEDPLYAAIRATGDGTRLLHDFAARADADPGSVRWSYRRDFGNVRLLMTDTRAARVLDEQQRAVLPRGELAWLREQALADGCDHLLIGTSLPWLLPPTIHDAETWNAALCAGGRGPRWARFGERLRRAADLEHWAAFPRSFTALSELVEEAANGHHAPSTVCVLSGDVHHAYIAEPRFSRTPSSRVLQLTCSPMHNSIPAVLQAGFRFGWSRTGQVLGRALARHGRVPRAPFRWKRTGGPWFGNQLMTLALNGQSAALSLDQAEQTGNGEDAADTAPGSTAQARQAAQAEHARQLQEAQQAAGRIGQDTVARPAVLPVSPAAGRSRLRRVLTRSLVAATPPASTGEQSHNRRQFS